MCSREGGRIESDFISWRSPAAIAQDYGLADRTSVYRHAHALGLFPKRQRNVRAALEKIIERAGEVDVTAPAVPPFRPIPKSTQPVNGSTGANI
jgi:hypothetical protein